MADSTIRSESTNVEEIMRKIRARIRARRGAVATGEDVQTLTEATLEQYLSPEAGADLRAALKRLQDHKALVELPLYEFDERSLVDSPSAFSRGLRRLLGPLLRLLFNPDALVSALRAQSRINRALLEHQALLHQLARSLAVHTTRLNLELEALKMRAESLATRLEFDERRTRAVGATPPRQAGTAATAQQPAARTEEEQPEGEAAGTSRSRRRRRRRGRRAAGQRAEGAGADAVEASATEDRSDGGPEAGTSPDGVPDEPAEGPLQSERREPATGRDVEPDEAGRTAASGPPQVERVEGVEPAEAPPHEDSKPPESGI